MGDEKVRLILSNNIKLFRKQYSWSQIELAEKASISVNFLSDIETRKKWPYPGTIYSLAKALNIEVHELFMQKEPIVGDLAAKITQYTEDAARIITESLRKLEKSYIEQRG
jgi:transcriptional regulator with XRE-family HTH domain